MSNKYSNGIIYKIVCDDGHYYFGSTTQLKLNLVFNNHKCLSKNNTCRLYEHIHTIGWDKVKIELVEKYPCMNKKELNTKEEEHINKSKTDFLCLNNDIDDNITENDEIIYDYEDYIDTNDYESIYSTDSDNNNTYKYGKIYKLVSKDSHYYIGSTTKTLQKRFSSHKYSIKNNTRGGNYTYLSSIPLDDINIELIENYPCSTKSELREREDYHIQNALYDKYCLNTYRAFQTDEEKKEYDRLYYSLHKETAKENMKSYYEENKDTIMEYHRKYNEENKEIINQKRTQYRKENAEILAEKQRQYALNNIEKVKESKKKYNEENKEKLAEYWKEYAKKEENKERIKENKRRSAQKIKEENKDKIAEEREKKKQINEQKKQDRINHDRTIIKCSCGGSYQNYQKKRHEESKKHQNVMNT
jgi:hypothetical protein